LLRRIDVRITLKRTLAADDVGEGRCEICDRTFWLGSVTAWAISDNNVLIGVACPACLEAGVAHIERCLEDSARWSRLTAEEDERIASEGVSDAEALPTAEEYRMLEQVYRTPIYRNGAEAGAALARGDSEAGSGLISLEEGD
jgi:hypothetical protein